MRDSFEIDGGFPGFRQRVTFCKFNKAGWRDRGRDSERSGMAG